MKNAEEILSAIEEDRKRKRVMALLDQTSEEMFDSLSKTGTVKTTHSDFEKMKSFMYDEKVQDWIYTNGFQLVLDKNDKKFYLKIAE